VARRVQAPQMTSKPVFRIENKYSMESFRCSRNIESRQEEKEFYLKVGTKRWTPPHDHSVKNELASKPYHRGTQQGEASEDRGETRI